MSLKTLCILNHKETYFGVSFGMFHLAIFPCFHALKKCNPNTEEETKNHVSIFNFFTPLVFFAFWKHFMQVFPLQTELLLSICILQFWHFPLLSLVTTSVERHQKLLFFGNCSFMTRGSMHSPQPSPNRQHPNWTQMENISQALVVDSAASKVGNDLALTQQQESLGLKLSIVYMAGLVLHNKPSSLCTQFQQLQAFYNETSSTG